MTLLTTPRRKFLVGTTAMLGVAALGLKPALAQAKKIKASPPVLVTSIGQSLDAFQVQLAVRRASIPFTYEALAAPSALDDGIKTLFMAVGASKKGFGDAGITINDELKRTEQFIEAADKKSIPIVVLHMGGEERRDALSDQLIDLAAPRAKYLIIREDSDADGKFAGIAKAKNIPMDIVDGPVALRPLLDALFSGV